MARPRKTTVEKKAQTTTASVKPAASAVAEEKKADTQVTEMKAEEDKAEEAKTEKPAQQTAAKKEVYVEYNHEQFMTGDIVNRIKETYKSEGHRISSIKSLKVYVDPVQRKAYYVINEKAEGKSVDL